ncbi:MAG: hypothetical protein M3R71_03215, partial [Actinomycetota bacterium]|nr:hypothetical protein [Actinomycetota bacterium]
PVTTQPVTTQPVTTKPAANRGLRAGGFASQRALDSATTEVHGAFGTARLLQTSLVNALIFPDGRIVAGFVNVAALEAAAAAPAT